MSVVLGENWVCETNMNDTDESEIGKIFSMKILCDVLLRNVACKHCSSVGLLLDLKKIIGLAIQSIV